MDKEKLKNLGKKKMFFIAIIGVLGVLLIIFGTAGAGSSKKETPADENFTDNAYIEFLENKICNVIAKITNDTSAAVLITCDGGTEHVYVSNADGGDYVTVRTDSGYAPVLYRDKYPSIVGVSVVCRGGDDPSVQRKLIAAISTALGVSSNRICIVGTK